jgi:hypothetical protein
MFQFQPVANFFFPPHMLQTRSNNPVLDGCYIQEERVAGPDLGSTHHHCRTGYHAEMVVDDRLNFWSDLTKEMLETEK